MGKDVLGGLLTRTGTSLKTSLHRGVAHRFVGVEMCNGLTEAEFAHVLSTFPLVPDPVKLAAQNAYRDAERGLLR